ncbi:aldo/keto reductase [Streptomyces varsoviensis]|uniref:aldo/keto reductase n=1 Tax=Streptomyces varsoviensis TaxID=67373 RepID=UPI00340BA9E4
MAELRGWAPPAAIQAEYSLLERTAEGELFGAARGLGIGVVAWSPLAGGGGVLSGKYARTERNSADARRAVFPSTRAQLTDRAFGLLGLLTEIAHEQHVPVCAVALAWLGHRPKVTALVIGCRTARQLEDNLASLTVDLSDPRPAELDALTAPELPFPLGFLRTSGVDLVQGGATINGVPPRAWNLK